MHRQNKWTHTNTQTSANTGHKKCTHAFACLQTLQRTKRTKEPNKISVSYETVGSFSNSTYQLFPSEFLKRRYTHTSNSTKGNARKEKANSSSQKIPVVSTPSNKLHMSLNSRSHKNPKVHYCALLKLQYSATCSWF